MSTIKFRDNPSVKHISHNTGPLFTSIVGESGVPWDACNVGQESQMIPPGFQRKLPNRAYDLSDNAF